MSIQKDDDKQVDVDVDKLDELSKLDKGNKDSDKDSDKCFDKEICEETNKEKFKESGKGEMTDDTLNEILDTFLDDEGNYRPIEIDDERDKLDEVEYDHLIDESTRCADEKLEDDMKWYKYNRNNFDSEFHRKIDYSSIFITSFLRRVSTLKTLGKPNLKLNLISKIKQFRNKLNYAIIAIEFLKLKESYNALSACNILIKEIAELYMKFDVYSTIEFENVYELYKCICDEYNRRFNLD